MAYELKPPSKKIHPYVTVEELRRNHSLLADIPEGKFDPRFGGGTDLELFERYSPEKEKSILECGALFGAFTKYLQDKGYQNIHALDLADMLHYPDRGKLTMRELNFSTEKMPYEEGFFQTVVAWGLLEHLENPFHFIRECHRVLMPGRYLILSMPNLLHIRSRLKFLLSGMFPRWNPNDNHIVMFPRGVFEKAFLRHFDLVETKYIKPHLQLYTNKTSRFLPAGVWFGNYVVYVLKKKPFIPYA